MNSTFHILKRILRDGKSYVPAFLLLGGIGLILIPIEFYGLLLSRKLVDKGFLLQDWNTTKGILLILIILGGIAIRVLFGVALLKQQAKLAKVAGAFEIAAIILGLLAFVAMILEIILFFQEERKGRPQQPVQPAAQSAQ